MSYAEVLAEIPHLSHEQLREVMALAAEAGKARAIAPAGLQIKQMDGRIFLESSRIIRQVEIDRILEDFP